jgi:hypothetical protein
MWLQLPSKLKALSLIPSTTKKNVWGGGVVIVVGLLLDTQRPQGLAAKCPVPLCKPHGQRLSLWLCETPHLPAFRGKGFRHM